MRHCADHGHFFSLLISPGFLRAAWIGGRLVNGLAIENCFLDVRGPARARLFLPFQGFDTNRLQEGRSNLWCSLVNWTSPASTTSEFQTVVRGAASSTTEDATMSASNQRSRISLIFFPPQQNFLATGFQSSTYGACLHSKSFLMVKFGNVLNSNCGSNSSDQHADSRLKKHISLPKWGITHIRLLFSSPHDLLKTPMRDTVKLGCDSKRPRTTSFVNWKT